MTKFKESVGDDWQRLHACVTSKGERDAATGGVMYTDEGELEFDEDGMAALEGQHLDAEFRCGIY